MILSPTGCAAHSCGHIEALRCDAYCHCNLRLVSAQVKQATLVPLAKATAESCGSKAAKCAQLATFAQQQSSFKTAAGVCIPFGSMELALKVGLELNPSTPQACFLSIRFGASSAPGL